MVMPKTHEIWNGFVFRNACFGLLNIILLFSSTLQAEDKDPVSEKLDAAKTVFEAQMKKLGEGVELSLQRKEDAARKAGDKKLVDQILTEKELFESEGVLPKVVATIEYQRQVKKAFRAVEVAYKQAIKDYLVSRKDDAAETTAKELEEVQKRIGKSADLIATNVKKSGADAYRDFPEPLRSKLVKDWEGERDALVNAIAEDKVRLRTATTPQEIKKYSDYIRTYTVKLLKHQENDPPYIAK